MLVLNPAQGIPTVLLGMVMLVVVPNGPRTAWFLTPEEREALHVEVSDSFPSGTTSRLTGAHINATRRLCLFTLNVETLGSLDFLTLGTVCGGAC